MVVTNIICLQVFSVKLNHQHVVVHELDIFSSVGLGAAHDEIVPFSIKNKMLHVNDEKSTFEGELSVEFVKVCCSELARIFNFFIQFTCGL